MHILDSVHFFSVPHNDNVLVNRCPGMQIRNCICCNFPNQTLRSLLNVFNNSSIWYWDNPESSMFSRWLDLPVTSVCLPAVSYEWSEFSLEEAYWKRVCILLCHICVKFPPSQCNCFYFLLILQRNVKVE